MAIIEIRQLNTKDKTIGISPLLGASLCAGTRRTPGLTTPVTERESSNKVSPSTQLEEYVHFIWVLNGDISSSITNDPSIRNSELLDASDADVEYTFFNPAY